MSVGALPTQDQLPMFSYKDDPKLDELERRLHEQLTYLRQQYEHAAQPIIRQLAQIQNMRVPQYSMQIEDAKRLGLV